MKKYLSIFLLFVSVIFYKDTIAQHSSFVHYDTIKRPWLAGVEVIAQNAITNRYNNFVGPPPEGFSNISLNSWKHNFETGLTWDWNNFGVNYIGHPYQGALYYSSPRSLGLTFWESAPYALLGSASWEFLGETHPASGNDLINTTMGGIFLGEILYRLSDLVLDGRALGFERVWRESLGFIINPIRGFNRLVTGKMKSYNPNLGYIRPHTITDISLGANGFTKQLYDINEFQETPIFSFNFRYGDPYNTETRFTPYDVFNVNVDLRFSPEDSTVLPSMALQGYGNLMLKNISLEEDRTKMAWGIFQVYDYINLPIIEIGDMSLTGAFLLKTPVSKNTNFRMTAMLGPTLLSGSNSEVLDVTLYSDDPGDTRTYVMGPGFISKFDFTLENPKWGSLSARYSSWGIYITSGPKGFENLNVIHGKYQVPIYKKLNLGAQYTLYDRKSNYDDFDDVDQFLHEVRTFLAIKFN